MEILIKRPMSFQDLANKFDLDAILLKESNHIKGDLIASNSLIKIPGYKLDEQAKNLNDYKKINYHLFNDFNNYSFDKMKKQIENLRAVYPFIKKKIIGYSVLKKPIYELRIGRGPFHTHFNASFHGNEWITTAALMKTINEYALLLTKNNDPSMIKSFNQMTISIIPMVNPDGVDLVLKGKNAANIYEKDVLLMNEKREDFSRWKANIRGVDLNKQFPAKWDIEQKRKSKLPTFRDFPGEQPLTEPEAIAIANYTRTNNFKRVHALHTQGEEIYWGFDRLEKEISEKIVNLYAKITGYEAVRYVDNYAGYKDWFIKTFKRPGFTVELGKGENPLPFEQFQSIYEATLSIFLTNLSLTF